MERPRWNLGQPAEKIKTMDLVHLSIADKEMCVLSLTQQHYFKKKLEKMDEVLGLLPVFCYLGSIRRW